MTPGPWDAVDRHIGTADQGLRGPTLRQHMIFASVEPSGVAIAATGVMAIALALAARATAKSGAILTAALCLVGVSCVVASCSASRPVAAGGKASRVQSIPTRPSTIWAGPGAGMCGRMRLTQVATYGVAHLTNGFSAPVVLEGVQQSGGDGRLQLGPALAILLSNAESIRDSNLPSAAWGFPPPGIRTVPLRGLVLEPARSGLSAQLFIKIVWANRTTPSNDWGRFTGLDVRYRLRGHEYHTIVPTSFRVRQGAVC